MKKPIIYPADFERIWGMGRPSRLSGRKEMGFRVYLRMEKENKELRELLKKSIEVMYAPADDCQYHETGKHRAKRLDLVQEIKDATAR